MRLVQCVIVMLALALPVVTRAAEWMEYTSKQDLFMVVFPEQPKIEDTTWKSEYGLDYPARVYTTRDGKSTFKVMVVNMLDAEDMHRKRAFNNNIFDQGQGAYWMLDIMSSMQYEATKYRMRPGVKVTHDAFHYIDLVAGHQLHLVNADQTMTHVALYLHKNRLYVLEGTVPPRGAAPNVFTESLQFVDENGNRVRYRVVTHNELPPSKYGRAGGAGRGGGQGQEQQPQQPGGNR